jgi:hypothetical protein
MKKGPICILVLAVALTLLFGCGGDGGSGSGSGSGIGTVSMDIADARPFIAGEQPDELWLVFEEVLVHKSGGGWLSLDLPETQFEINLLAFSDGRKTELVTPTLVTTGHITQIRFVISRAYMVFAGNPDPTEIDLDIPSGVLRTDKQFDWWLDNGGGVDITVHFDLSKSIVETGGGEYKLKPVIHLFNNNPQEAATICGSIDASSFVGDPPEDVIVTIIWNGIEGDETYTVVTVTREPESSATGFCIFWLVPLAVDESYTVQIDNEFNTYQESVAYPELGSGEAFDLNGSASIIIPTS